MSRRYGPIGTSVWDSRKFLELDNDSHRLGYLYLIACPHGNSLGVFRLPVVYFAADRRTDKDAAEAMLADMERVGLVERGDDEQIRITRWFYNDTGANNPSTGSSFCKVFKDTRLIKRGPLRTRAFVEMFIATLTKAESWNPESTPFAKMVTDLQNAMAAELKASRDATLEALRSYPIPEPNTLLHTVLDTVSYTMGVQGVAHVWDIEHVKLIQETETVHGDSTRTTETVHGDLGGSKIGARRASSPPPSTPAKGSRSGGKVPEDVQSTIASLTAKSKG